MDLSKLSDLSKLTTGSPIIDGIIVVAVITLSGYALKKRQSLLSKFKSTRLFLFFRKVKEAALDIYQRILQNRKSGAHGQELDDYIQSFDEWESEDSDGITLFITRGCEPRTYYGVTKIRIRNNFVANNAQDIIIIHKKQGTDRDSPSTIEFVSDKDVQKLAKKCYYQKILGTNELKIRWAGHWYSTP